MKTIELNYKEQQSAIANDVWYDVLITYWNEKNNKTKEVSFITQYPSRNDIEQSIYNLDYAGGKNLKAFGGKFDYYEITSVKEEKQY